MKAILEFNLPEEEEQFNAANKGMDWALIAWDMDQLLYNKLKHEPGLVTSELMQIEEIREKFNAMLVDKGLQYPE